MIVEKKVEDIGFEPPKDLEVAEIRYVDPDGGEGDIVDPDVGVRRDLVGRHVSMIALAGIIGAGIIVGTGNALHAGGPAAVLIGYTVIGVITFSVMQSIGELSTLFPSGGGFLSLGFRFVNNGFGFAIGWNYFIVWATVLANEYNTMSSILSTWSDKVPLYGYFLLFWAAFTAFQFLGVKGFGEAEFWLALVKLLGITAYFLFSLVYVCGGIPHRPAFGFHYWNQPGAFSHGFAGVANVFVFASTYYVGTESVAIAATESRNPARAVPKAINQVFFRIVYVYVGMAIFIGMTCPWDAEQLSSKTKALASPLTVAIQNAGWHNGYHLVNAFLVVILLSAINSSIYLGSRTVLFMAKNGAAPKFMARTVGKTGIPIYAALFTQLFGFISLMNMSQGAKQAFNYIINISGVSTFVVWAGICFMHLRFRSAWKKQGHEASELPFKSSLFPWNPIFGVAANVFLALVQGWSTFAPFKAKDFVDAYIVLPVTLLGYVGMAFYDTWRIAREEERRMTFRDFWNQLKWHKPEDVDLVRGRRVDLDIPEGGVKKLKWYQIF